VTAHSRIIPSFVFLLHYILLLLPGKRAVDATRSGGVVWRAIWRKGLNMLMSRTQQPGSQSIQDFITVEEAIRLSGYTAQYLRRMARQGRIQAMKFGHFWMVNLKSLQGYIERTQSLGIEDKRYGPRESEA
jgi:excisionase family DNA binding protein